MKWDVRKHENPSQMSMMMVKLASKIIQKEENPAVVNFNEQFWLSICIHFIFIIILHLLYFSSSSYYSLLLFLWFQLRNLFARELPIKTIIHCILKRRSTRQISMKVRKLIIQFFRSQHERIMNVSKIFTS